MKRTILLLITISILVWIVSCSINAVPAGNRNAEAESTVKPTAEAALKGGNEAQGSRVYNPADGSRVIQPTTIHDDAADIIEPTTRAADETPALLPLEEQAEKSD